MLYATGGGVISKNGTLFGGATWTGTAHKDGGLVLPGGASGGYVEIPPNILDGHASITVATWINFVQVDTWARIFDFAANDKANGNVFATPKHGSGNTDFDFVAPGASYAAWAPALTAAHWMHVAFTVNATTSKNEIWVDGVNTTAGGNGFLDISQLALTSLYIGKSHWPDPYLNATLDDFRIYTRALSATEIAALAQQ